MSGGILISFVDFPALFVEFDHVRCASCGSFSVRNWCGSSAIETWTVNADRKIPLCVPKTLSGVDGVSESPNLAR